MQAIVSNCCCKAPFSTIHSISMSFLYNIAGSIWNTAASYFPAAGKYCEDHNISWTTTGNVAMELAAGPLAVAQQSGKAAMTAVAGAIPAWTFGATDLVSQVAHSAIAVPHAWYFGGDPSRIGTGAAMAKELAVAVGAHALQFGYHALESTYAKISCGTDELMQHWTEALAEAEDLILGPNLVPGVDGAVLAASTPLSWDDEDVVLLRRDDLQYFLADHGAAEAAGVEPSQQPALVGICTTEPSF